MKFSLHFHKKAKKWYIKHYYGSSFIGKKLNKKGELVRRYKQNYKFEYLDLSWNENPVTIEERDTNLKTKNLLNQKIRFLRDQELHRSNQNSNKLFFPWAYSFIKEYKDGAKSANFKPVIDHLLAFSSEKLLFSEINERFCKEFKKYISEDALTTRGLLKTTTTNQYFNYFKFLIKICFLKKFIKENYSKKVYLKNESIDLQDFININEIKTLIKSKSSHPSITNAFLFGCLTGLGEKDLKELEWLDFELNSGVYYINLNRINKIFKLRVPQIAIDLIGTPIKVRGKVFFKLKSTYYTNLKLKEWLNSSNVFKKITFKSCKYTYAANYLLNSEVLNDQPNDFKPSLDNLSKTLGHKELYFTKKFVDRINFN